MRANKRAAETPPTHKRRPQSVLSGRSFLVGCIGLALSISTLVLVFGESAPPMFEAPDIPLAAAGQPPTVERDPTPAAETAPTPSSPTRSAPTPKVEKSEVSPPITTTKPKPATGKPVKVRVWSAVGTYEKGELVTYRGSTYRALQDYTGVGDPDWIYAESLWVRV